MVAKKKISRREREASREEAARRFDEVASLVSEARKNDEIGSHYSLWIDQHRRVEWWPGAQHWRCSTQTDHFGAMDDLLTWLRSETAPGRSL